MIYHHIKENMIHYYHPEWKHYVKIARLGMVACQEKLVIVFDNDFYHISLKKH